MTTIEFNGKHYPILRLKVYHAEFYPEPQWLTIADESLSDAFEEAQNTDDEEKANDVDEVIYYYKPTGFDFSSVKVGDLIELDTTDFEVKEIEQDEDDEEEEEEFSQEEQRHMIKKETDERLRELICLCHPNEHGEPYSRYVVQEECERRGKQLLINIGWPVNEDSIYKNKWTGGEYTLKAEVYHLCMEREQVENFDTRLNKNIWSVMEHYWPKEIWVDDELFDKYKEKLGHFMEDQPLNDSIDSDDEDEDEESDEGIEDVEDEVVDKETQKGLGDW